MFRAKQLCDTTPLAMKSPVPVVMSYIGSSRPRGSIEATRRFASLLIAMPSIDRFLVIAGSVVWKNRMTSLRPPRSRTTTSPFALFGRLQHVAKAEFVKCPGGPVDDLGVGVRQPPGTAVGALGVEDAARKPQIQSRHGKPGQLIRCSIASRALREWLRIARIGRRVDVPAEKSNSLVRTAKVMR